MERSVIGIGIAATVIVVALLLPDVREPQQESQPPAQEEEAPPQQAVPVQTRAISKAPIDPVTGAEVGSGVPPGEIGTWQERQSQAHTYLSRVQGGLDTPLEQVLAQMPNVIPERRMSGDRRIFTYTFDDGSRAVLTFRPRGSEQGLVLYTAEIEE